MNEATILAGPSTRYHGGPEVLFDDCQGAFDEDEVGSPGDPYLQVLLPDG